MARRSHVLPSSFWLLLAAGVIALAKPASAQTAARDNDLADGLAVDEGVVAPTTRLGPPRLVLSPVAEAHVSDYMAVAAGGSVTFQVTDHLRLGGYASTTLGVVNGLEGCSTREHCYRGAWWAGGLAEAHLRPGSLLDPWVGIGAGRYTYRRGSLAEGKAVEEDGAEWEATPRAGLDLSFRPGGVYVGVGFYGGMSTATGGALAGTRVLVGM